MMNNSPPDMMQIGHSQLQLPIGGLFMNPMPESSSRTHSSPRRLFIGDIPKNIKADSVKASLIKLFPTAAKVEVYSEMAHGNRNRGFAFLEYERSDEASRVRNFILNQPPNINGRRISCDWAQLEPEVSEDIMKQVKVLFVRNVHLDVTEERLHDFFGGLPAGVEKVKRQKMHAFVHFNSRKQASIKKEELNGQELNGLTLEIAWSKPKPRAHPYMPLLPTLHPLPSLFSSPLPELQPILPVAIRQPDVVMPMIVSQELLNSKPGLVNQFQVLYDLCLKTSLTFPLFMTEVFYSTDPHTGLSPNYRIVSHFENGIKLEGELRQDLPGAMETLILTTQSFVKNVWEMMLTNPVHQSQVFVQNKGIPWV